MSNNTSQPKSIEDLIKEIKDHKLVLPEFQRDFTWTMSQSEELFDSIFRGIFIGALIFSKPKFSLACKKVDLRPRGSKKHRPKPEEYAIEKFDTDNIYTILDGQQRVTSLYRAITGIDPLYIKLKSIEGLKKILDNSENEEDLEIEEYIDGISSKYDSDYYCISISEIVKLKTQGDDKLFEKIHQPILDETALIANEEEDKLFKKFLIKVKYHFNKILSDQTLLSVHLLDMELEKFCKFFERSNSRGVTLTFMDILTAKLYIGFNLRDNINSSKDNYPTVPIKEYPESFVRYISFLVNDDVSKKSILENLNSNHFNQYWEESVGLFSKSYKYLEEQNIFYNMKYLPYKTMIIPVMEFVRNLPNQDFSQATKKQIELLKFWFWISILDVRFGGARHGSTNGVIREDCIQLRNLAKNKELGKKYWQKFKINLDKNDLLRLNSNNAVSRGLYSILNYQNDFKKLENHDNVEFNSPFDIHHIFPVKYLEDTFGLMSNEYDLADSFLNKMIINKIPNIKYGKKPPSQYLSEFPINENGKISESLDSHLIPKNQDILNGKYDSNFIKFLEDRYEIIFKKLNDFIIKKYNKLID